MCLCELKPVSEFLLQQACLTWPVCEHTHMCMHGYVHASVLSKQQYIVSAHPLAVFLPLQEYFVIGLVTLLSEIIAFVISYFIDQSRCFSRLLSAFTVIRLIG